jgi:hypothetical protein
MKRIFLILGTGLISLICPAASQATLLDFTFSFSNTAGNVAGTVTGEIFGLTDNATGPTTNITLISYPAGLGLPPPSQLVFPIVQVNSFTVTAGEITFATFRAFDATQFDELGLNVDGVANFLLNGATDALLLNNGGFTGTTYTRVQATPEPSSVALLGTGLAALWQFRRRRLQACRSTT